MDVQTFERVYMFHASEAPGGPKAVQDDESWEGWQNIARALKVQGKEEALFNIRKLRGRECALLRAQHVQGRKAQEGELENIRSQTQEYLRELNEVLESVEAPELESDFEEGLFKTESDTSSDQEGEGDEVDDLVVSQIYEELMEEESQPMDDLFETQPQDMVATGNERKEKIGRRSVDMQELKPANGSDSEVIWVRKHTAEKWMKRKGEHEASTSSQGMKRKRSKAESSQSAEKHQKMTLDMSPPENTQGLANRSESSVQPKQSLHLSPRVASEMQKITQDCDAEQDAQIIQTQVCLPSIPVAGNEEWGCLEACYEAMRREFHVPELSSSVFCQVENPEVRVSAASSGGLAVSLADVTHEEDHSGLPDVLFDQEAWKTAEVEDVELKGETTVYVVRLADQTIKIDLSMLEQGNQRHYDLMKNLLHTVGAKHKGENRQVTKS